WAGATSNYPREASIPELFRLEARRRPGAVALEAGELRLTYGELESLANALARCLEAEGVGAESTVGLLTERSPEMVVALLAILKAGGAYLPLDPSYPAERLRFMVEDGGVSLVLASEGSASAVAGLAGVKVLPLEGCLEAGGEVSAPPEAPISAEQLAYVMYTSGSTGLPKGTAIPHRAVVRLVKEADFMHLGEEEVFLHLAPISFDASTLEVWGPLLNGGRLVLAPSGAQDLAGIGSLIREHGVTSLWLTAGLFHVMVDERLEDLASLRQLLAGGDVLSPPRVAKVLALPDGPAVINGYGPTENTTFTACHIMAPGTELPAGTVPIGRPIADTRVYVVDAAFRLQPLGVPGELVIGGDGLARGYRGRAALTAERFVPSPFGESGGRLYRTGDRARFRAGGELEFLGRLDAQVKIRGFRIEPGEVESVLSSAPGVERAAVTVREDTPGERRLVGYYVPEDGGDGGKELEASLRAYLEESLPSYMVPAALVELAELPLTPNGKVDRKALPAPADVGGGEGQGYLAPRNQTEELIAGIWSEVLGVDQVGVKDDFFGLGGHSLLATQVSSRLRNALGTEVPLRLLFENPTVAGLAAALAEHGREDLDIPPLVPASREGDLPLSFAQQRLWFIDQLEPGSPAYNMPLPLLVEGDLNPSTLEAALTTVVARHESLRTRFESEGGRPRQVVDAPWTFRLPLVDLQGLPKEGAEAVTRELVRRDGMAPFDLAAGPLLRGALLRRGAGEHVLVFNMHHIVSDGWSLG
ncbi:MAG: amino acid adenylation domain-containing protein, partial [Acidobacteria bacterium]|nr:amino acid adenylation domain-containing protein [Acidobacteriota bacterium]